MSLTLPPDVAFEAPGIRKLFEPPVMILNVSDLY